MDSDYFDPINQMCEVVLEEETSNDTEPNKSLDLPPVPRFDLQSEQFTYFPPPPPIIPPQPKPALFLVVKDKSQPAASLEGISDNKAHDFAATSLLYLPAFRKVYVSPDKRDNTSKSLETEEADELKFYKEFFSDTSRATLFRLHCTTCDKHIGCGSSALNIIRLHRTLLVLVCKRCYDFYGDDKFPTDKEDNTEVFCRWCGQGGKLVCCSYCPKVFCYKCITRNFNPTYLKEIEDVNDWACFFCAGKPLWPFRGIARALVQYMKQATVSEDISTCCRKKPAKEIATTKELKVDQPMVAFNVMNPISPTSLTRPRALNPSPNVRFMDNVFATARRLVAPSRPVRPPVRPAVKPPVLQRAPLTIRRGLPSIAPKPLPKPTRMPTPGRTVTLAKATGLPPAQSGSKIKRPQPRDVLVDHMKSNTTLVRVTNPGGREQYFRIIVTGNCMKIPTSAVNPSFSVKSLEHAFQLGKMAFDRLLEINKASSSSEVETAESLLSVLDGWKTLIGYVEDDVKRNLNVFRNQNSEPMRWQFVSKCKGVFDQDSDIEIIEDESSAMQSNTSLKRKNTDIEESSAKISRFDESVESNEDDCKLVNGDGLDNDNDNSHDSSNGIVELASESKNPLSVGNEGMKDSEMHSANDNKGTSSQKDDSTDDVQTITFDEDEEITDNEKIKDGEKQMSSTTQDGEDDNTFDIGSKSPVKNAAADDGSDSYPLEMEDESKIVNLQDVTDQEDGGNENSGGDNSLDIDCNKNEEANDSTDSYPLEIVSESNIADLEDIVNREEGEGDLECDKGVENKEDCSNYREPIDLENHEGMSTDHSTAEQSEEGDLDISKESKIDGAPLDSSDSGDCHAEISSVAKNIFKPDDQEVKENCVSEAICDQIIENALKPNETESKQDPDDLEISEDWGQKDFNTCQESVSGGNSTCLDRNKMEVNSPEYPDADTEYQNINNSQCIKLVDVDTVANEQQCHNNESDINKLSSELGQAQNTASDNESHMQKEQALFDDISSIQ